MGNGAAHLLLLLVLCYGVTMAVGLYREEKEDWRGDRNETHIDREEEWLLLQDSKPVVKTDAGEMRVLRNYGGRIIDRPMHIGFITMEPRTLFVPQYIDSSLILFIRTGEAKVGLIYKDELAERRLKIGDIYRIPAGSAFYLMNAEEGQRLNIICSIDPSESLGLGFFQSFYIGGGTYPTSILAGFELETLSTAFNVTTDEVTEIMTRQHEGPIVFVGDSRAPRPSLWTKFLQLKEQDRLQHLKRMVKFQQQPSQGEEQRTWSWRKLLISIFGQENKKKGEKVGKSPDSYNIYDRRPDFRNNYGWSIALDESDYQPLKYSGIGVYLVNLTAGSMLAPHVNPTATEYGIVLRGSGRIQIVFPNGTQAMDAIVKEGDAFWVPRYFPFCQIAARSGPFEFFGFTTSARENRPQFLVGANSILQTLRSPVLAAAFGVSEDRINRVIKAQREAVILPSASAAPPDEEEGVAKFERVQKVIKSFGNEVIMGFD
ncbi:vicilin-like seed storage protein [Populus alba x Populus x berolinensis]|uniref:Vicilin-like seed storage protein n=1 Tax=Populus alba x Populus x berolinensis TaxID=444605 RepID=A0AAD6QBF4_9ROSI|nr:vicilin-like seed storage protein [Populus alba x Populus x berolinensis]